MKKNFISKAISLCVALTLCAFPVYADDVNTNESSTDIVSVTLPSELPFRLILPKNGGTGFVDSDTYLVTNTGSNAISFAVKDVFVSLSDNEHFFVGSGEQLPDDGNQLNLTLNCSAYGETTVYTLSEVPQDTFSCVLGAGESMSLWFGGIVSERTKFAWGDISVCVSIRFETLPLNVQEGSITQSSTSGSALQPINQSSTSDEALQPVDGILLDEFGSAQIATP